MKLVIGRAPNVSCVTVSAVSPGSETPSVPNDHAPSCAVPARNVCERHVMGGLVCPSGTLKSLPDDGLAVHSSLYSYVVSVVVPPPSFFFEVLLLVSTHAYISVLRASER